MTSADVTSHPHSTLSICHLSLSLIIVNHDTWAEFSSHEACINQDFPHHLTLQLSTPPMMVAFECHRLQVLTLESKPPVHFRLQILTAARAFLRH